MPRFESSSSRSRSRSRTPPPPLQARRRRRRSLGGEERRDQRREAPLALTASQEARIRAILREREEPRPQFPPGQQAPPAIFPIAQIEPPAAPTGFPVAIPGPIRGGNQRGRAHRGRGAGRARGAMVARAAELYTPGPDVPICRRHLNPMCHRCMFFNRFE